MKYETIFRRLNEAAKEHAQESGEVRFRALQEFATELAIEAMDWQPGQWQSFRIVIQPTEVRGFFQVELQHYPLDRGSGWETQAFGYIDTIGGEEPQFVTRFTNGGDSLMVQVHGTPMGQVVRELLLKFDKVKEEWQIMSLAV